ncbi:MAG: DUF202 domain-containing protein [Polyangiaceae bacterium]|nr:DUF202 domain-containing protein [Polyangiaceae bacterium]
MSFQRSRMSADRTMMSIIRTSLSLIGFGFTIYQFFGRLQTDKILSSARHAPRNFGLALVSLGLALLTLGIVYHLRYMGELRAERTMMTRQGLIHGETSYPISLTVVTAALLWIIGALAIVSMVFRSGPFN